MRVLSIALVLVLGISAYAEPTDSRHVARTPPAAEAAPSEKIRIELIQPAGSMPTAETERDRERQRSKLLRRLDKLGLLEDRDVVIHADGSMTVNAKTDDLAQIRAVTGVASATPVETSSTDST